MESAIELKHVAKSFAETPVLKNITFSVTKGCVHVLLGPNGAGKTTSLKILAGLLARSSGEVYLFGQELKSMQDWRQFKSEIGLLLERPPLYDDMEVGDYLHFVATIRGLFKNEAKRAVNEVLERVGLTTLYKRSINHLSHGQRQRVGIAQAILGNSKLVILDEPTLGLDPVSLLDIRQLITSLKKERTVLLSTHQLHEAEMVCDELTIIRKGEVVLSGTLAKVREQFKIPNLVEVQLQSTDSLQVEKIHKLPYVRRLSQQTPQSLRIWCENDQRYQLLQDLIQMGLEVVGLQQVVVELEDIFYQSLKGVNE